MVIEKPKLFLTGRDFAIFVAVMLLLISLRLFYHYSTYREFVSKPFYFTYATIINHYPKSRDGREYSILKLKSSDGLIFFTSTPKTGDLLHKRVRVQIYPNERISFWDYMGHFYVKSRIKEIYPDAQSRIKTELLQKVSGQHTDQNLSSFYNAIFFATPIPKELREKIAALGVSHLVALSGFHLGILWGLIYGVLALLYRPLQQRYFPYRFMLLDVGFVAIALLGVYVWFVDMPPSLVRSYAMVVAGWLAVLAGIELLSFTFLATVALLLLLLFPELIVSIGFWLSVAGVFYIFLLLQYTKEINKWVISLLIIPVGIFVLMLPIVHSIFGATTSYQLLSPLLSVLFIPFYPIVMLLHIFGTGDMLDGAVSVLFGLPQQTREQILPVEFFAGYIILSILAIRNRRAFYLLLACALGYAGYLFVL